MPIRHAYLHGFASSSRSHKGQALREYYASKGVDFLTPDITRPSFGELTYTGMLGAVDALDEAQPGPDPQSPWRFVGSSMGGYIAARWAQLHPARVDRLLLLCPAFDFAERWRSLLGDERFARWREQGSTLLPDATGVETEVHWGLVEDARRHPPRPPVPCETIIVHGTKDEVVPIESSRAYAEAHADRVRLVEVDDDHGLVASLPTIQALCEEHMIPRAEPESTVRTLWWDHFGPTALGTAEHFRVHLDEFLAREGLEGCETGVEELIGGRHAAAWCRCPEALVEAIGRALRPRRVD
jgi:fermentation-respiration switch protein FrsA (DUF1100 family)